VLIPYNGGIKSYIVKGDIMKHTFKRRYIYALTTIFSTVLTLFILVATFTISTPTPVYGETSDLAVGEEVIFEFTSMSDIHLKSYDSIEMDRFTKAIQLSYQVTDSLDAIVINGDFTDGGHDPQYARFNQIIEDNNVNDLPVLVNLGNHENGRNESDPHEFFEANFGYGIDNAWELEGFNFIALGVHYGDKYLDSQAVWLDSQLAAYTTESPDKPVFVLIHYPTANTTPKSNTANGRDTFEDVMSKYSQVINITGHTHFAIRDPRLIHQKDFTSFNNSSISYTYVENYDYYGSENMVSQGEFAIFKITNLNRVLIERYVVGDNDISESYKVGETYVIDIPKGKEDFRYTTDWYDTFTSPSFEEDASISVTTTSQNFMITFDQANGDPFVYYYTVYVKDLDANEVIHVARYHSEFFKQTPPSEITRQLRADLKEETSYEISIVATNVASRSSEPLTEIITID